MPHNVVRKVGVLLLIMSLLGIMAYSAFTSRQSAYAASTVTVNGATKFQTIDGFGFSEAFGRANSMATAPAAVQKQMTDLLFSTTNGAGLTILRNIINSDASSIEPNSPGSPSATPRYVWDHSDSGQVWLTKQALSYGVTQIYANAWSAPGYMKTNNSESNGGTLCGVTGATCSSGDWRQAYANYLVQYLKDYQSEGITIPYIGFVNEPDLSTSYSSMVMSPAQTADFAKVLGPTLKASGLGTKFVCCDPEGWNLASQYASAITSDPAANAAVDIISSHGYTSAPNSVLTTAGNKHVWQTEWANFDTWDPAWDDGTAAAGFTWAQRIYTGLTAANLSAFLHWWGLNTSNTNSGLLHLNGSTVEVSKRFWAFANYSRFIRPGATRISATSSNNNLMVSAFLNSNGSVVVVALNAGSSAEPVSFSLQNAGVANGATVSSYLTNGSSDLAAQAPLTVSGGAFSATVPARSLVTYQISGSSGGVTPTPTTPVTPTSVVTPTPTRVVTPSPTATSTSGTCRVSYTVNQWPGGFTANIVITNTGSAAINGWTLKFAFPGSQQVTQGWNGVFSQSGNQVTITNASYNSTIPANGSVNPGFNGSWSGSNPPPTAFTLNGTQCSTA